MRRLNLSMPSFATRVLARLAALITVCVVHGVAFAATLPAAPTTFDTTYAAPTGATVKVAAGSDLQAALDKAQLGDTIVLQAGATFTGPFRLPNKTSGSGWIYVVSSNLSNLPPPGTRVAPTNASNMPKIVAPNGQSALTTVATSHHFRFAGIEFAPASSASMIYTLVAIGNNDVSPATLPNHIVFDRCYVHGDPAGNDRRGIEMDGAHVAVVDSYISNFQETQADSQGLWAYNTTGPLKIVDNYIEAATENVLFGGADSHSAALVPADIEIRNNQLFKPLSLIGGAYPLKNLLEFKAARRVLVSGNTLQNNPQAAQSGIAVVITVRNQGGNAPWSVITDLAIIGNTISNVGGGFGILGQDYEHPSQLTERVLIRNNIVVMTALNGAANRAFQMSWGGSDFTIDHNTIVNEPATTGNLMVADKQTGAKVNNFTFTNNLVTPRKYGFGGVGTIEGTASLNGQFSNWVFSKNVIAAVESPGNYPAGNFFPTDVAAVRFMSYAGGNYALAAGSPYKGAGTDGKDIGADLSAAPAVAIVPNPPGNVVVK